MQLQHRFLNIKFPKIGIVKKESNKKQIDCNISLLKLYSQID